MVGARHCKQLTLWFAVLTIAYGGMGDRCSLGQYPDPVRRDASANMQAVKASLPLVNPKVISFSEALSLVSGQNPQIAFTNEQINEAFAQLRGAKALWLPSLRAGVSYNHHDGSIQATEGRIEQINRSSLNAGLGTLAIGSGSPAVAGISANVRVTDAVFQPRIAGQEVSARRHAAKAAAHDLLLFAAVAYLDLLRAFQQQAIAQETLNNAEQLARLTAAFAYAGQGSQADDDRARTELALRRNAVAQATVQTQIASARLVELLNLPPDCVLVPEEPTLVPIDLVSAEVKAGQLVAEGLSQRPELAESRHLVAQAVEHLERERHAPLLPSVVLGVSQGGFGGGTGCTINNFRGRFDLDAGVYWELRNFGAGDAAAREAARSRIEQTKLVQIQLADRVAREIVEAHAQSESLRGQITVAESGIRVAWESYERNLERIRGGQGLPLEVLQSIQALDQSQREYLRTVGDYDEWQFRLYRAMGCPIPREKQPTKEAIANSGGRLTPREPAKSDNMKGPQSPR